MTLRVVNNSASLRQTLQQHHPASIGLVPTMGNLHEGHLSLVRRCAAESETTVATIFVNPLQFGAGEDLEKYPRTLADDRQALAATGCDILFAPDHNDIYPQGLEAQTTIHVPGLSDVFCGGSRPGHFDGVATVVCKLFNLVQPSRAYFGLKDYQQFLLIRKMVADLALPIAVLGVETQRDATGLALSSRNSYLTDDERKRAPALYRCLSELAATIKSGERDYEKLQQHGNETLRRSGFEPEYLSVCRAEDLQPASGSDQSLVILAAARLGTTRLIDNIHLQLEL